MRALGVAILDAVREMSADERAELGRLLGRGEAEGHDGIVPELLTVVQAAGRARCHPETVRRAIRSGTLVAFRAGSMWRISPEALTAWLGRPRSPAQGTRPAVSRAGRRQREHGGAVAQAFAALDNCG
jgi:excisionase family DNA binding protein